MDQMIAVLLGAEVWECGRAHPRVLASAGRFTKERSANGPGGPRQRLMTPATRR